MVARMTDEPSQPTPLPGEAAPRSVSPDAPTVLVVDDEPSNLASIEKIFQRDGMRVLTADGAKAALEIARSHKVQVVLTDLMMPGVSGIELLQRPTPRW